MSFLGRMTRAFVIDRLARGGRRRALRPPPRGYGSARRAGSRGRGGFFGPVPYYPRRTRGGSRVAVSGCCLPIPLGFVAALTAAARLLTKR